jgi:glucose/arabinose dehydrogenase
MIVQNGGMCMRVRRSALVTAFTTLLVVPPPVQAAVQLTPVVSGLSSPVFLTNAGDNTNRIFIIEQGGIIKVLQPNASTPSVFLDIHLKVLSGGERGLLGLAFHPQYALNRRFFVYYTRSGDGACVIAEYNASSANGNVADPTEMAILTIPHPTNANHNGGMLAFGRDGYLYAGVGDGGGSNDPPNNAQNIEELLGKILRINVDVPAGGNRYSSPADNPYVGGPGRDEIFAIGMRNPWRFSFDRLTDQQWVADVGQGSREEVDTPIMNGGNYGWRVMEGTICNPGVTDSCVPSSYIPPIFDYTHTNGRCSITGGYVYRGAQDTFTSGTYVYADYCSGEVFTWNGTAQVTVLDTALNISSFGEDEAGELYVVALGGSVSKITATTPCSYAISPTNASFQRTGGTATVTVTAAQGCAWTAVSNASWITITGGASGSGNGTVSYSVGPYGGPPKKRVGGMTIAGTAFTINQTK